MKNAESNASASGDHIPPLMPYVSDRLDVIAKMTVMHTDFKAAVKAVDGALKSYLSSGETICLRVEAEAGCGKTHLSNRYIWRYPETRRNGQLIKPIMRVRVPPKPTIKGLASAMLEEYEKEYAHKRRSEQQISSQLDFRINQCETAMIFVEEMHHFVDEESNKRNIEAANWLKIRLESTRRPFVVSGLPRTRVLFDQDDQLKDRFNGPYLLKSFIWFTREAKPKLANMPFRTYLHCTSKAFPFKGCIDFGSHEIALRFFIISKGVPRHIGKLLKLAAMLAEEDHTETIDLELLKRAYRARVGDRVKDADNPFSNDYDLASAEEALRDAAAQP